MKKRRNLFFAVIKWLALGLVSAIIALLVLIFLVPNTWLSNLVSSKGSARFGRSISIEGPISIDWDWSSPFVHIGQIHIANAAGEKDPDMVSIDQTDFHIKIWDLLRIKLTLPDVTLDRPIIILEKTKDGHANWDFPALSKANFATKAVLPSDRSSMPFIGLLAIKNGSLTYRDAAKGLDVTVSVDLAEGANGTGENDHFKLSGKGTMQKQPFKIDAYGGSLDMLRNTKIAYPLDLKIMMGKTVVGVNGTFTDPIKMSDLDATLELQGNSMADLFYLTTIPLPPTPTYKLSGHLSKRDNIWSFDDFKGVLGKSDLSGNLSFDASGNRAFTKASLNSKMLRIEDLGGLIGTKTGNGKIADKNSTNGKVLPDMPLDLTRLRSSDMDVSLTAEHIDQPGWPLDNLEVHFMLKDGILTLAPFSVGIADGTISGKIVLDGSKNMPDVSSDLTLHALSLRPFFQDSRFESFSKGRFGGRFQITGEGRSSAEVLGDSDGRVTLLMMGGTVSKLIVDAAGLDFGKATPELLGSDETTNIRCVIGDFNDTHGLLNSNIFIVDTGASNIQGKAAINLQNESMDIKIEAHPKSISVSAHTPILVNGTFSKPSVELDPKELAARGAAAAALVFLTPLASIIPFIEPGLGKDSDCQHFVDEARSHSGAPSPPAQQ